MSFSTWPGYCHRSDWIAGSTTTGSSASSTRVRRALGVLETKFDNASKSLGCSDTFLRLKLTVQARDDASLLGRLPLAWAALRAQHPSLACTIQDGKEEIIPGVSTREFCYRPPASEEDALTSAMESLLVEPGGVDTQARTEQVLHDVVLNGPRVLLSDESCLARLIIIQDERIGDEHEHSLILLISHVISDGLSIIMLVKELFALLSAEDLPTPPSPPSFTSLVTFLAPSPPPTAHWSLSPAILASWKIFAQSEETMRRLPLSSEHHYPALPILPLPPPTLDAADGDIPTRSAPSDARRRWQWAILRTMLHARHRAHPPTLHFSRMPAPAPPAAINSEWPTLRFSRDTSKRLVGLCKHNKISPSMLLYSILSISISNIFAREHPSAPYHPITIGMPFSNRPFLDPSAPNLAQDLAIRLNFGCIQLPSLPQPEEKGERLRWTAVQGARLAKRQFALRFAPENRTMYLADAYFCILQRLLNSTGRINPLPFNEPQTALNASMIGDLDRLLPTVFSLPSTLTNHPPARLSDMLIGTRLHRGEGMLVEAYTFDQRLTMSIGFDKAIVSRASVEDILARVDRIGKALVEMLTGEEVAKHSSAESLWIVINGQVYDLTNFAPEHPGGMKILLQYAAQDATEAYDLVHAPGTIEEALAPEFHLGPVDLATVEKVVVEEAKAPTTDAPVSLGACLNIADIEAAAETLLKPKAFAYYASAADDERTKNWNHDSFAAVRFRPRVLRDVTQADLSTTMLGQLTTMPIFVAPAAMGRLAHPEGEKCLARIAGEQGIPYIVSANSSISFNDIAALNDPQNPQTLFYQLYVNKDRSKTEAQLRRVVAAGYKAICVTVDAPVAGKRERDERSKMDAESAADDSMRDAVKSTAGPDKPQAQPQGIAQNLGSYVDPQLNWNDIAWVRKVTDDKLPIIVKGIQCAEDAALCVKYGVKGIYLSNHGGRQLEGAPSSIETLLEIRRYEPQVFDHCEVYLDGGIKRGTDVLKALALGATAVGVGRPFMYSLTFGDDGVRKVATILRDELAQNMRLLGATTIKELVPEMVNARALEEHVVEEEVYGKKAVRSKGGLWSRLWGAKL